MNKKIALFIFIAIGTLMTGCANNKAKNETVTSSVNSVATAKISNATNATNALNATTSNATNTTNASNAATSNVSNQTIISKTRNSNNSSNESKLNSSNKITSNSVSTRKIVNNKKSNIVNTQNKALSSNYIKYSGTWLTAGELKNQSPYGLEVSINIDKYNNLDGVVSTTSNGYGHISNVNIKGKITNGKFSYNFDEDGWGHSGTIQLQFEDNTIIYTSIYGSKDSNPSPDWGIAKGTYTLFKGKQ